MLTQEQLKSQLHYSPETGIFTWLVSSGNRNAGEVAGSPNKKGYIQISVFGKLYRANRLAWLYMTGAWPKKQVDHIDTIKWHDWWSNLREATNGQNKMNSGVYANNKSGYRGVSWYERNQKWGATCTVNNEQNFLGLFPTAELASAAREAFAKIHHGEFYRGAPC